MILSGFGQVIAKQSQDGYRTRSIESHNVQYYLIRTPNPGYYVYVVLILMYEQFYEINQVIISAIISATSLSISLHLMCDAGHF